MPYYFLIPFCVIFVIYIIFENKYNFKVATTLKLCLSGIFSLVGLIGAFAIVGPADPLFPTAVLMACGLCLSILGDFYLQYIKKDRLKFKAGIIWFAAAQVTYIIAFFLMLSFGWTEIIFLAVLLVIALFLMKKQKWDTSEQNPQITIYTVLLALMAAKALTFFIYSPGNWQIALGGILFFMSDMMLGIWNYYSGKMRFANLDWIFYFAGQMLLAIGVWSLA